MIRFICPVCGRKIKAFGGGVGVCPECIRERWEECRGLAEAVHESSRRGFRLPLRAPRNPAGVSCSLCSHRCRLGPEDIGFCAVRTGRPESMRQDGRQRARCCYYLDPIPTNCVADWVCPGGTGAGYPAYSNDESMEVGYYNLAVFFEACNFDCLYCQNWSFKRVKKSARRWHSIDDLAQAVTPQTSCVCFFGGDPIPQLPYALRASEQMRREHPDQILRICWETNGSVHPAWLKRMAALSLDSGGCIKIDLKAWNSNLHKALCGSDNQLILENFARLAELGEKRPDPPFLVASTVLVPGYVEEEEVWQIASFIARLNPDIPYVLLAFAPELHLDNFPTTSNHQAEACLKAAKEAGLRRVRLGNRHLVGARCF